MRRMWFTTQQQFDFMPLKAGLGLVPAEQLDEHAECPECKGEGMKRRDICELCEGDGTVQLVPKPYTTRKNPIKVGTQCVVVQGSRMKAQPVIPRIEFKIGRVLELNLLTELVRIDEEWGSGGIHGTVCHWELDRDGLTFPELDYGIKGVTFNYLRNKLIKLNKGVDIGTPFYIHKLESTTKWLYDLDKVLANHKSQKAIPEHLIKEGE